MKGLNLRIAAACLACLALSAQPATAAASTADKPPVLLVHGWSDKAETWWHMGWTDGSVRIRGEDQWTLYEAGVSPVFYYPDGSPRVFLFDHNGFDKGKGCILQNARNLRAAIEEIKQSTEHDEVYMVAHSMRGLVARAYMQELHGITYHNDVMGLCTITSPHRGVSVLDELKMFSGLVDWRGNTAARQMRTSQPECLIEDLNRDIDRLPDGRGNTYSFAVGQYWPYWGDGLVKTWEARVPQVHSGAGVRWQALVVNATHSKTMSKWYWDQMHPGDLSDATDDDIVFKLDAVKNLAHDEYARALAGRQSTHPSVSAPVATSLVFDVSTSMDWLAGGRPKIDVAREAGQTVVDILENYTPAGSVVGVATFSEDSESILEPTEDYRLVRDAVSSLYTHGGTDMLAGIRVGVSQLESASGAGDKAIIYLSDGDDTAGNAPESIIEAARQAGTQGIAIYTIGFGESHDINEPLLEQMALVSGGVYGYADPSVAMDLVARLTRAQAIRSGATPIFESTGVVRQDETAYLGVATVPPDYGDLEVILAWPGSDLDVILVDPAGAQIDEGYPGLEVTKTERTAQVTVAGATPGDWELSVYGTQTSMAEEPFYALAAFRETTGTVPAAGGGTGGNDGSGLLLLLLVLVAGTGIGFLVVGQRRPTASVDLLPDPGGPLDASNESSGLHLFEESTGRRFDLRSGVNAIGRSSDNDIVLADSSVSRHHAVIVVDGDQARVKDLKSTSGLFVEDRRVEGSARLAVGARVKLGGVRLRIESSSPSEEPDRIGS